MPLRFGGERRGEEANREGLEKRLAVHLLNAFVRPHEHRGRNRQAERLRRAHDDVHPEAKDLGEQLGETFALARLCQ